MTERIILLNMYVTQCTHRLSAIPVKVTMTLFTNLGKITTSMYMKPQKSPIRQSNLEQKEKAAGIMLLDIKMHYKATVIKTVWYWHKVRSTDPWNRMEN